MEYERIVRGCLPVSWHLYVVLSSRYPRPGATAVVQPLDACEGEGCIDKESGSCATVPQRYIDRRATCLRRRSRVRRKKLHRRIDIACQRNLHLLHMKIRPGRTLHQDWYRDRDSSCDYGYHDSNCCESIRAGPLLFSQ